MDLRRARSFSVADTSRRPAEAGPVGPDHSRAPAGAPAPSAREPSPDSTPGARVGSSPGATVAETGTEGPGYSAKKGFAWPLSRLDGRETTRDAALPLSECFEKGNVGDRGTGDVEVCRKNEGQTEELREATIRSGSGKGQTQTGQT